MSIGQKGGFRYYHNNDGQRRQPRPLPLLMLLLLLLTLLPHSVFTAIDKVSQNVAEHWRDQESLANRTKCNSASLGRPEKSGNTTGMRL